MGNFQDNTDQKELALVSYKRAYQLDQDNYDCLNNLGLCLQELDQPGEAVEYFKKAIAVNPKDETAYLNLANSYEDLNESE